MKNGPERIRSEEKDRARAMKVGFLGLARALFAALILYVYSKIETGPPVKA